MGPPGSGPHPYAVPGSGPVPYPMAQQGYPGMPYPGPQGNYSPLPAGMAPNTFTKQLQALELEEIPQAYKIGRPQRRWVLPAVLASACITVGVIIGVALFTRNDSPPEKTLVRITSIPSGGTVKIDDQALPTPTPVEWTEAKPGTRYKITVERKGHKTETREITVTAQGGEIPFLLDRAPATLIVHSNPEGAEVFLNGKPRGRTPATLNGLDVKQSTKLELKLSEYEPFVEMLDWKDEEKLEKKIELKKLPRTR